MALVAGIQDHLVQVDTDWEEGTPVFASSFAVVVEDASGARWAHSAPFVSAVRVYDEEEGVSFYRADQGEAQAAAERLLDRVEAHLEAGGALDLEAHWVEIDPAYGSQAYQELDAGGYFRDMELQAARDAGEAGVPLH